MVSEGSIAGEEVARFVLDEAERAFGGRALVGRRPDVWPEGLDATGLDAARRLATVGVRGVSEGARRAAVGLAVGTHVSEVARRTFTAREVIALQARGRRCVSMLSPGEALGPYSTPLAFVAHDLDHLALYFDPLQHRGQLGFFRRLDLALEGGLGGLLAAHDARFEDDVLAVGADTNGSPVFALASLLMKLKMAVRRARGRETGEVVTKGPLDPAEERAFTPALEAFCAALGLPPSLMGAARTVGTRRAAPEAGRALLSFFEAEANDESSSAPFLPKELAGDARAQVSLGRR